MFAEHEVPAIDVKTIADLVQDPHLWERGSLVEVDDDELGTVVMQAPVPRLDRRARAASATPVAGRWATTTTRSSAPRRRLHERARQPAVRDRRFDFGHPGGGIVSATQLDNVRVGVDIGGTFTDVIALRDSRIGVAKVLSTPDDLSRGVIDGISLVLGDLGASADDVGTVVHATTAATNALLERTGGVVALLVTEGFGDILEIARQRRPDAYDLFADKLPPLVPRSRVVEIRERLRADGTVERPLAEEDVRLAWAQLEPLAVEAVAVAFLHAYADPSHERRAVEILSEFVPDGRAGLRLARGAVRAARVRAHEHDGDRRLPVTGHERLSAPAGRAAGRARGVAALLGHEVQRRPRRLRARGERIRRSCRVRPGGRRDRRRGDGQAARARRPAVVRHGRDDGQGLARAGRRAEADLGL